MCRQIVCSTYVEQWLCGDNIYTWERTCTREHMYVFCIYEMHRNALKNYPPKCSGGKLGDVSDLVYMHANGLFLLRRGCIHSDVTSIISRCKDSTLNSLCHPKYTLVVVGCAIHNFPSSLLFTFFKVMKRNGAFHINYRKK